MSMCVVVLGSVDGLVGIGTGATERAGEAAATAV